MTNDQSSLESNCKHEFNFIRSEEKNVGCDRDPLYLIRDVFFCKKCLAYRRVDVRKERQSAASFGCRLVVERLA